MFKVYDQNHEPVGMLVRYSNYSIEHDISTGDKKISFEINGEPDVEISLEGYVRTEKYEFVIKSADEGHYEGVLNLEGLDGEPVMEYTVKESSLRDAVNGILDGTGWELGTCEIPDDDIKNAGMIDKDKYTAILELCACWMVEAEFDSLKKKVNIFRKQGKYRGCYMAKGLNLRKIRRSANSYDFYTRIIPIGADGMTIESVNDGKDYLENHQYSNKIKTYVWKDEQYTEPEKLKEDAEKKLNDLSKPDVSYECDVIDLAKQSYRYNVFAFGIGDEVILIDPDKKIRDKQRIIKMTEYPDDANKNKVELGSVIPRFTEMLERQRRADEISVFMIDDGKLEGTVTLQEILQSFRKEQ